MKKRAKKQKTIVDYGHRIRNIGMLLPIGVIETVAVKPGNGPKPNRYAYACCGSANTDCVQCRVPPFSVARGMR